MSVLCRSSDLSAALHKRSFAKGITAKPCRLVMKDRRSRKQFDPISRCGALTSRSFAG
jgi:hypothetical protein